MVWTYLPLDDRDFPKENDIVWCRFPHEENLEIPGDKCRPVLVHAIERNDDVGRAIITVRQGTSLKNLATKLRYEFTDLIIDKEAEVKSHGLRRPTRFDLRDRKCIPVVWCREFFTWPDYAHRLYIGRLDTNTLRRLNNRLTWRKTSGLT